MLPATSLANAERQVLFSNVVVACGVAQRRLSAHFIRDGGVHQLSRSLLEDMVEATNLPYR
jgi:hypothetical protein